MKAGLFLTFTLTLVSPMFANVIVDPYPGSVCSDPSCDVIGLTGPSAFPGWTIGGARYDVESVSVGSAPGAGTSTNLIFTMRFNYDNGDASLAPFPNSANTAILNPGDLLFGLGGSIYYGIPLINHDGLTAGHLYGNGGNPVGTQTAQQVLNDFSTIYRFNWPVWLANGGLTDQGGFVSYTHVNGTGPEVIVTSTINVDPFASAFFAAINSGQMSVSFASATCGNDVLTGPITNLQGDVPGGVPEPVSSSLFGGGLLALAALGRKRIKKQLGK